MTRRRRRRSRLKWVLGSLVVLGAATVAAGYAVLANMDLGDLRAAVETQARAVTGRELKIAGPVDLDVSLTPAIAIQDVTFGNAPWGTYPELVSVRRIEVEVALLPLLTGEVRIRRLIVKEPTILLETSQAGQGNWVLFEPEDQEGTPGASDAAIPTFRKVEVQDARVLFRDGQTGAEHDVRIAELRAITAEPGGAISLSARGSYGGHDFAAEGSVGTRDQLLGGGAIPLDLRIEAANATVAVAGSIEPGVDRLGLDLKVSARGDSLADLSALAGAPLPPLGPYEAGASVSDTDTGFRLRGLALKLGDSDLSGAALLELDGARPRLKGAFAAGMLDLAALFDAAGASVEVPAGARAAADATPGRVIPDTPLPLDALRLLDGEIKLTAETVRLPSKALARNLDLSLTLEGGNLRVDRLAVDMAGGQVRGDASLDARETGPDAVPEMALNVRVEGFDYGRFLAEAGIAEGVTGAADIEARLRGRGRTPRALAATLDGQIDLSAGAGSVRNDLLRASGAGLIDMVAGWREGEKDLRLNCVVMRLPVEGGVVGSDVILLDTEAMTVGATGRVDLRDESLHLRVASQAKQASLMSLAVPVRVLGTLAAPTVVPDPVGTVVGAAKIAGLFINPLVAGAAILIESQTGERNPCVAALEGEAAAPTAAPVSAPVAPPPSGSAIDEAAQGLSGTVRDVGEGVGGAVKGLGEGLSKGLKGLLGD